MDQIHHLGLGRLLGVAAMVVVEQQQAGLSELVVAAWGKLVQVQVNTAHLVVAEARQAGMLEVVEVTEPVAVAVLRDLQQMLLLDLTDKTVEKAAHS